MKKLLILLVLLLITCRMIAWDEISHSYITHLAIEFVKSPELKALLEKHENRLLAGSWYPDWDHFSRRRLPNLPIHQRVPFGNAYLDHLKKDEVNQRSDYEELLAHCFGALAHAFEDQWYDLILMPHLKAQDQRYYKDHHTAMLNVHLHRLYRYDRVEKYLPTHDLIKIFSQINYLEEYNVSSAYLEKRYKQGTRRQYQLMEGLKIISFLSSKYFQNRMPWAAQNMMDAPGGYISTAKATAAYWEALYTLLTQEEFEPGQEYLGPCYAEYDQLERDRISFILPSPTLKQDQQAIQAFFIDETGNKILALQATSQYNAELVKQFIPEIPLEPSHTYTFHHNDFSYQFTTPTS